MMFAFHFQNTYPCHFGIYYLYQTAVFLHVRVNKVSKDLQGHQDKLESRRDQMTLSFRKEIR